MDPTINSSLITEIVNTVKSLAGLFTVFPLNVFILMSIGGAGFGLLRKGKKAAR